MADAGALSSTIAALAVLVAVTLGVVFVFRAIPWSRPGPWSLVWLLVWTGATAVVLGEASGVLSRRQIDPTVQLGILALTGSLAAVAMLLDSRRRALAARVASAEAEQRDLMAALPNPVILTDAEGTISSLNRAAMVLVGARALGRRIDEVVPFVALPSAPGLVRAWHGRITDTRGHVLDAEVQLSVALRGGGASSSAAYVVHDVTEHTAASRLREQLLYSVAHEIRQPLTVLDNSLDILSRDYLSLSADEFETLLASSRRTVHRLRSLMDKMLNAGSIESGRFSPRLRPAKLREIVDEVIAATRPELDARDQQVAVDVIEDLTVMVDALFVQQVVANLLENASKYGPRGEEITIRAARDGRVVRISVTDHGRGIPADQQADLFQRFYRAASSSAEPGIGLGLAIAKGIVEAHGGHIGVVSEFGSGTTAWFTLPAAAVPATVGAA